MGGILSWWDLGRADAPKPSQGEARGRVSHQANPGVPAPLWTQAGTPLSQPCGTGAEASIPGWHANPQTAAPGRALGLTRSLWLSGASPRPAPGPSGSESGSLPWLGARALAVPGPCSVVRGPTWTRGGEEAAGREEGWGEGWEGVAGSPASGSRPQGKPVLETSPIAGLSLRRGAGHPLGNSARRC